MLLDFVTLGDMSLSTLKKFTEKLYEGFLKFVSRVNKEMILQVLVVGMTAVSSLFPKVAPALDYVSYFMPYITFILICIWNWYQNRDNKPPIE